MDEREPGFYFVRLPHWEEMTIARWNNDKFVSFDGEWYPKELIVEIIDLKLTPELLLKLAKTLKILTEQNEEHTKTLADIREKTKAVELKILGMINKTKEKLREDGEV